jgi:hypothetical protein
MRDLNNAIYPRPHGQGCFSNPAGNGGGNLRALFGDDV